MKSILTNNYEQCYICGSYRWLEDHHIYFSAKRKISEANGFKVPLCHRHHTETPDGVHFNIKLDRKLKAECQAKFEENHSHEEFMNRIGRNFL